MTCHDGTKIRRGATETTAVAAMLVLALLCYGCSDSVLTGGLEENEPPVVDISNGPVEGDETGYSVHFFWKGHDTDGHIERFELALVTSYMIGFDPADTTGSDKWTRTVATDSVIMVSADQFDTTLTIFYRDYSKFDRTHTFFVRAIDDRGGVSNTDYRTFTAWTLAPLVSIDFPRVSQAGDNFQSLCPLILFRWRAQDPVDYPWNYQEVDSTRYLWAPFYVDIVEDLNARAENVDGWSEWISADAPEDSAYWTIIGDDEVVPGGEFIFAVQAKDEAGAVTLIFDPYRNVRHCRVMEPTGPLLTVKEPYLGTFSFIGTDMNVVSKLIPPGYPVEISWRATAAHYGAIMSSYRYGWDIQDIADPAQWDCYPSPYITSIPVRTFGSGIHTLYIEAKDHLGTVTIGVIELEVISGIMERDLLWIDDFRSTNFIQVDYSFPTEAEHDLFWTDICLRAGGFNPVRDIYDVADNGSFRPPLELLWKYKNVIWTYSGAASDEDMSSWNKIIEFKPEELYPEAANMNMLQFYTSYGGHIWSLGHSMRTGALAAVLPQGNEVFPANVKYDVLPDEVPPPYVDIGEECFAYNDYCVSFIDKITGQMRPGLPFTRLVELDAMDYAYRDQTDVYLESTPGFPERLELWSEITMPGRFFDPSVNGFTYVEIYDPEYWIRYNGFRTQDCIHPIFRMKTRASRSCLNDCVIAFWTTRYEHIVPPGESAINAPNVQFGIPLWFFNRNQADSIADAIFEKWGIK